VAAAEVSVAEHASNTRAEREELVQHEANLHRQEAALHDSERSLQAAQQAHDAAVMKFEQESGKQQVCCDGESRGTLPTQRNLKV
jgi:Tfp pilus assembly protein PilX